MIVCTGCGNANQTRDEFCGSCGAYLEWHGERIGADPPPPDPLPMVVAPVERPGLLERVRYVVGLDDAPPPRHAPGISAAGVAAGMRWTAAPADNLAPPMPPVPLFRPDPPPAPIGPGTPLSPAAPFSPLGPNMGSAPVVPSYPPGPPEFAPRPPEVEYERPPALRPDPVDLGPADLYCGSCGTGNQDERRFCRRCGASLADAHRPPRPPWWRRIFGTDRRADAAGYAAGQRPREWAKLSLTEAPDGGAGKPKRRWRFPRRIVLSRIALPLMALGILGMGLGPMRVAATGAVFDVYHGAKRTIAPDYVHVTPRSATATDAARNRPAAAAIDRNTTSYWSEGRTSTGAGAVLTIVFDRPIELAKIGFHNGAAGKEYPFEPRLRAVEVRYLDGGREVARKELALADKPDFQTFDLAAKRVETATIRIVSVYAGQRGSAASLAEVEFLTVQ